MTNEPVKLMAVSPPPAAATPSQPTAHSHPTPELFAFVSKHIALVTALAVVIGIATATAGLSAYIRVFDWRLVWVIEYPDVLKWGLVSIAMIVPLVTFAWSFVEDAISWVFGSNKWGPVITLVIWGASLTWWLVSDYRSAEPHYGLSLSLHVAVFLTVFTTVNIAQSVKLWPVSMRGLANDFVWVLVTATAVGSTIGYVFRDSDGFQQHVTTKTTQYRSVGLVMITSRYVVIYDRDHVVTIPAEDVIRIEGQPQPGSHNGPRA